MRTEADMSVKIDDQLADKIRQGFKVLNKFMVLMWRLGFGFWFNKWPEGWGQIMVITHTGRKSGLKYRTPVNYAIIDGEVYCIAGFGKISDWYRNLLANPEIEIWLPDGWWQGVVEDVSQTSNRVQIMRAVVTASGFAGSLFGVDPKKLDDHALKELTQNYQVLRIHRTRALTGPGGPGELGWIWQVATFILLPMVICRNRRK
jgi:deazaflavin-dependent oxidoreductase (nitroreductase family)